MCGQETLKKMVWLPTSGVTFVKQASIDRWPGRDMFKINHKAAHIDSKGLFNLNVLGGTVEQNDPPACILFCDEFWGMQHWEVLLCVWFVVFCRLYHCSCRHELVFSQWGCLFPLCFTLQDHLSLTNLCKVQEGALPILEG